ncbi:glycosyltransferase [Lactobacillus acidophilus]|uniref:glycosyltransferase family 2 protein n=1 Tax=Lactobacillus acidophilus TaxID=1579 RepID=UPI0021A81618|nr:glycosyltransferase [Lactobacillus acidophilus]MCT3602862.1 glycosyltransferase [Lactobacillus acidophilus]MCT3623322.1 glycosyltransferase [Lactobacillus acidophilus]
MKKKITLSIIIPVFNVEQYLSKCLDSIIKNSNTENIELILIDDGSTDFSSRICDDYSAKYNYIRTIHDKNMGVAHARNVGLSLAQGEWISWVDSDDLVSPNYVETLMKLIKLNLGDIYKFDYMVKKENIEIFDVPKFDRNKLKRETKEKVMHELPAPKFGNYLWCRLFKKNLFNDLRFPEGNNCEDAYLMIEILNKGKIFYYYDETLYYHIYHNNTVTTSNDDQKKIAQLNDWLESNIRLTTRLKELDYQDAYLYSRSQLLYIAFSISNELKKNNLSNIELYKKVNAILDNYKDYDSNEASKKLKSCLFIRQYFKPIYNIIVAILY